MKLLSDEARNAATAAISAGSPTWPIGVVAPNSIIASHSLAQALAPLCDWGSDNTDAVARIFAERDGWAGRQAS